MINAPRRRFRQAVLFVLLLVPSCYLLGAAARQKIVVRGSDSMIMLAMRWSEMMTSTNGEFVLDVNGGGPVSGLTLLASGKTDVAQISRKLTDREKNLEPNPVVDFPVAIESVVVYTHSSNPITHLSLSQLKDIFRGKTTNWKQVGGKDAPINLYSTESVVGGSLFFREVVLDSEEFDTVMQGFSNSKRMLASLAKDPNGIGFGDLQTEPFTKALPVSRGLNFPAVGPTTASLRTTVYPLSRYLYWATSRKMKPGLARVCEWILSQQGQLVVEAAGYYPLNSEDRSKAAGIVHQSR